MVHSDVRALHTHNLPACRPLCPSVWKRRFFHHSPACLPNGLPSLGVDFRVLHGCVCVPEWCECVCVHLSVFGACCGCVFMAAVMRSIIMNVPFIQQAWLCMWAGCSAPIAHMDDSRYTQVVTRMDGWMDVCRVVWCGVV
mmetsp:Transcript_21366/g.52265  ORF Transcript_21366/g.52265 Transcript_21366/m.52265 type:complete len:140 (+) Transcript_21366:459-878(+)